MTAFYIFGITELQDMYPLIMEFKKTQNCWVCFFDCFPTKKQFHYYSDKELLSLFDDLDCNIYRDGDRDKYEYDYSIRSPKYIFIESISPKTYNWFPSTTRSKVIHIGYYDESKHLSNSKTHIDLTILKEDKYKKYYPNNVECFGDFRMDNLQYVPNEFHTKRCFIVESYIRKKDIQSPILKDEANFYNDLIKKLKDNGYEIVWKKREKGYPKDSWSSPLDFCSEQPNVIIDKDLMLPSSLFYYSKNSDLCLFVNDCFAFFDTIKINKNTFILKSPLYKNRKYKFDEGWFDTYKKNIINYEGLVLNSKKDLETQSENTISKKIVSFLYGE